MSSTGMNVLATMVIMVLLTSTSQAAWPHNIENPECPLSYSDTHLGNTPSSSSGFLDLSASMAGVSAFGTAGNDTIACTFTVVCPDPSTTQPLVYMTNVNGSSSSSSYEQRPWSLNALFSSWGSHVGFSTTSNATITFHGSVGTLRPQLQWSCISTFSPSIWATNIWGAVDGNVYNVYTAPFSVSPPVLVSIACPNPYLSYVRFNSTTLAVDSPQSTTPDYRLWDGATGEALPYSSTVTSESRKNYRLVVWQIVTSVTYSVKFSCVATADSSSLDGAEDDNAEDSACTLLGTSGSFCWVLAAIIVLILLHVVLVGVMFVQRYRRSQRENGLAAQRGEVVNDDTGRDVAASEREMDDVVSLEASTEKKPQEEGRPSSRNGILRNLPTPPPPPPESRNSDEFDDLSTEQRDTINDDINSGGRGESSVGLCSSTSPTTTTRAKSLPAVAGEDEDEGVEIVFE